MKQKLLWFFSSRTRFLIVLLFIVMVFLSLMSPYFLKLDNLLQITQFGAVLALLGMAQALVMVSGNDGIDLSIGAIMSLSGVLFGVAVTHGVNFGIALLIPLLVGGFLGGLNALLTAVIGIPPLIATLGSSFVYSSLALYITGGMPISGFPNSFKWLGQDTTLGLPNQVLFVVVPVAIILLYAVYRTRFGRYIYLVGNNEIAARFATINVTKVRFAVYTLAGVLAGVSSIIMSSWLMTARADVGVGYELQSIAVSVLGGIAVVGGAGHLGGVLLAVVVITVFSSGIQIANINPVWQLAVLGFILIFAVSLNQFLLSMTGKRAKSEDKLLKN
ncbi:MAG: ABC transporter permease [Ruminiclostridium sp.]